MIENIIALSLGIIICQLWAVLSKLNKITPGEESKESKDKISSPSRPKNEGGAIILFLLFTAIVAYHLISTF